MARKKRHEEKHEDHPDETWLIPYSDLLTLLLALFIVLFASSSLDKNKAAQIMESLATAFSSSTDSLSNTVSSFFSEIKGLQLGENIAIGSDSQGAIIDIQDVELFEYGEAKIKDSALPRLKSIAAVLNDNRYKKFRIIVEGNTDNNPFSSEKFESNWELSAARASAVVRVFIQAGVDPYRLRATGMADISPKYPNFNAYNEPIPDNQRKNNRVSIHINMGY